MKRTLFEPEHEQFRNTVRAFVQAELEPFHADWEEAQRVPREVWRKAGEAGLLCPDVPEAYGGYGADWLYNVVVIEELARAGMSGPGFMVHSEMVAPYLRAFGSKALQAAWLPRMVAGEVIGAVAMTEPGAGSDLKSLRTRAVRDGEDYIIDGQKTYISNGQNCDFVILACKTEPDAGARGVSLMLVEADRPGFERGRNLKKIGLKAQDTSELFFSGVRVPVSNRPIVCAVVGGSQRAATSASVSPRARRTSRIRVIMGGLRHRSGEKPVLQQCRHGKPSPTRRVRSAA